MIFDSEASYDNINLVKIEPNARPDHIPALNF
jgi:hypothetical protein